VSRRSVPLTEAQGYLIIAELGVLATCATIALFANLTGIFTVTKTAKQVKDVAEEAVSRL
jgi:hypothetical protein